METKLLLPYTCQTVLSYASKQWFLTCCPQILGCYFRWFVNSHTIHVTAPDILELDAANRSLHLLTHSRPCSMHSACVVLPVIPNGHIVFVSETKRPSSMYELERVLTVLDKNGEPHAPFSHM